MNYTVVLANLLSRSRHKDTVRTQPVGHRPMNMQMSVTKGTVVTAAFVLMILTSSARAADEYVKSYTVAGPAKVRVKVDDSRVRVITSDSNQVEFRVTSEGFCAICTGGQLHMDSQQNGNEVQLTVQQSTRVALLLNTKRLFTEVRMPKNADLELTTGDGRVELAELNGSIRVRTSDGSITASQLSGSIDLRSNDGHINARALTGTFNLHSGDGRITATELDGKCEIFTRDGAIHLAGRFDSLDVRSSDGAVAARAEAGSKMASAWNITTKNGRVDVDVPRDLQANLDASTDDGHISLGLPVSMQGDISKKTVRGVINGGGPLLSIHSGDGSIRLNAL
jgi:hypothetical protein